jgi:hypothetical protein
VELEELVDDLGVLDAVKNRDDPDVDDEVF